MKVPIFFRIYESRHPFTKTCNRLQEPEGAENNYVKVTRPYNRHHQFPDDTKSRFFGDKKMTAKCNEISFFFRTSAFIEGQHCRWWATTDGPPHV